MITTHRCHPTHGLMYSHMGRCCLTPTDVISHTNRDYLTLGQISAHIFHRGQILSHTPTDVISQTSTLLFLDKKLYFIFTYFRVSDNPSGVSCSYTNIYSEERIGKICIPDFVMSVYLASFNNVLLLIRVSPLFLFQNHLETAIVLGFACLPSRNRGESFCTSSSSYDAE